MLFFALLLYAGLSRYLFFERGYRYRRRLNERIVQQRLKVILTFLFFPLVIHELYQSLQSNTIATFRPDDSRFSYRYPITITAKEVPANLGRLGRSPQDIVEPVIPGPSKHREPLVEIASPYHIEAHEENTSDTMERSSQQAAPHSLLEHSDSETDASVALESSTGTGAVVANTTTDVLPWATFRNASSSSVSTGGDDEGGTDDECR
jgi:hypothetical protein